MYYEVDPFFWTEKRADYTSFSVMSETFPVERGCQPVVIYSLALCSGKHAAARSVR